MKKKNTIVIVSSILAVALIIGTSITPALARPGLDTSTQENKEAEVLGDDGGCSLCGESGESVETTGVAAGQVGQQEPPGPPCYTCYEAVTFGLSDAAAFVISIIPPIQDYVDFDDPGWMWLWLDAIASSFIDNNLIGSLVAIFDSYGYIPGLTLITAAVNAFVDDIWPLLDSLADKIENEQINHAVLTAVLGAPILASIFMFSTGIEFLKICLDLGGDNQNAGDVGAGNVGSTEVTGATVGTGDTQSASTEGSAGSISL